MLKAIKEAKARTTWTQPNKPYEEAVAQFVAALLDENASGEFLTDFAPFQKRIAWFGRLNSLSQALLKLTCPGVPDLYQGTEWWDLSLVDPDNRRPVDYEGRRRMLYGLRERLGAAGMPSPDFLRQLWEDAHTGEIKLYLILRVLACRNRHQNLFARGQYMPLTATGPKAEHVCAFARAHENRAAIAIVPRLVATLTGGAEKLPVGPLTWEDTVVDISATVPAGKYQNVLTAEQVEIPPAEAQNERMLALQDLLVHFPVALLERTD
jgi:(1->4)-alpha-D-glucan 1-alpha-D-glucosylmutase